MLHMLKDPKLCHNFTAHRSKLHQTFYNLATFLTHNLFPTPLQINVYPMYTLNMYVANSCFFLPNGSWQCPYNNKGHG